MLALICFSELLHFAWHLMHICTAHWWVWVWCGFLYIIRESPSLAVSTFSGPHSALYPVLLLFYWCFSLPLSCYFMPPSYWLLPLGQSHRRKENSNNNKRGNSPLYRSLLIFEVFPQSTCSYLFFSLLR